MQEIIKRILEGNFDYENGSLDFSCAKIELTLNKGSIYEGSFHMLSSGAVASGFITTTDLRMECLTQEFSGTEVEIPFCFHAENMEEGDVVKGAFSIVSNQGEYYLPFVVSIEHRVLQSSIGPVKNLFHFANLAKSSWPEAVSLFYSPDFVRVFNGNDAHFYDSYRALAAHPGNEQNMEEFLILINKKQKVEFAVQEERIALNMMVAESPYGVTESSLNLVRTGWGYTALHVECEGDFVFTEKEFIGEDDFLGNRFRLPVYIDSAACHPGRNFGRIYIYNCYVSMEIPVTVKIGENTAARSAELGRKRAIVQLMEFYQAFRMKKISTSTWLRETGKLVEGLVAMDERDVAARLFQAQLLITEGRNNEAGWLLDHGAELMEQEGAEKGSLWAYYLYLTTLLHQEESYVNQVTAKVEQIYRKDRASWRVAWLLLYLSEEYNKSASVKWSFLEKQFDYGCRSPVLYIEALSLINANPALLRKLEAFELHVLYYGAKHDNLSAQVVEQLLYHTGRVKEYLPILYKLLECLYAQKPDERVLQEICTLLVKGSKTGREYFEWYQKGVEAQLRITNLYEYYMVSVDLEELREVPKMVLMYFSYQNNLDYERSAFLYDYVLQHKAEYKELYDSYCPRIGRFVIEQLQKGRINRYLARLYQDMLSPGIITEQTAEPLSRFVFAHEIRVEDSRFHKVIVYQPGNLQPMVYGIQNGRTEVALYGDECTIVFEDAWGNRFAKNVEYTMEKLMRPGQYPKLLAHYVKNSVALDIYLGENERMDGEILPDVLERALRLASSPQVAVEIRRQMARKLLRYYYEADDMRALDHYLDTISGEELAAEERGAVVHYMVLRGKYEKAYEWIAQYDPYFVDVKTLMRLTSEMVHRNGMVEDRLLLASALHVFRKGKYDSSILEYLVRYYSGMTKDMRDIWKTARSFEVDCYGLCEEILVQMLFSGAFIGEKMEVFRYYVSQGAKQEVEEAFLAQCSYEYFVKEKLTEEYVFQEICHAYQRGESVQKICKLAYLKYFAENRKTISEEVLPLVEEFLQEMLDEGIHLNLFKELRGMEHLTRELQDKTIVEYRMKPGSKARIYYVVLNENGESGEYVSDYMQEVYGGVVFREFILFFGECLQYYIMEENEAGAQLTESGSVQRNDVFIEPMANKYGMINDMMLSKVLQDYDTLDSLLEEYYRKEFLNEGLFPLDCSRTQ